MTGPMECTKIEYKGHFFTKQKIFPFYQIKMLHS